MILKQLNAFLLIQPFGHTFAHCLQSCNFARPRRVYLHTYLWDGISVTRFGEISRLCQILKLFGNLWRVYLVFGKIVSLSWQTFRQKGKLSLL